VSDPPAPTQAAPQDRLDPFDPASAEGKVAPELLAFWAVVRRLPRYLRLAVALGKDGRVPPAAKAAVGVGGAYAVSPIDLVPGLIPVAGQLDDVMVLLLTLRRALRSCPPALAAEHLERAGLSSADLDADLAACRATLRWLAAKGLRFGRRLAAAAGRRVWGVVRPG
jgi:uncharacterized membrane protein YkvA (DUF1232 family)